MAWIVKTYVVVSPTPVVVEDATAGIATSYQPGESFDASENNPSVNRLLQDQQIVESSGAPTLGFLVDNSTGTSDLRSVLIVGNITGGKSIIMSDGDRLLGATDGGWSIGQLGDRRPANIYVGTQIVVGNSITIGTATVVGSGALGLASTGATADLTLTGRGTAIALNEAAELTLDTTSQTIVGAINELDAAISGGSADLAGVLVIGNTTGANDILLTDGQRIAGEDGVGAGGGADLILESGAGGPSGVFNVGNIFITGGIGPGSTGGGGRIEMKGGVPAAAVTNGGGGSIAIDGGEGKGTGNGGPVYIRTGRGGGAGSTGSGGFLHLEARAGDDTNSQILLLTDGVQRWNISSAGHLTCPTDNTLDIGAPGATRPRDIHVGRDVVIGGDLTVNGTTTTINSEIQTADNFILLNSEYTGDAAQTAGLVLNIDPAATSFSISGIAADVITVTAGDPSAVLSAGDFLLVQDPANSSNAGVYEVISATATTATIDATPVEAFSGSTLLDDATTQGTVVGIRVAAIRSNTAGAFETATGTAAPLPWNIVVTGIVEADKLLVDYITTGLIVGDCVRITATDTAGLTDADADATSDFIGVVETIGILGTGKVVTDGVIPIRFAAGLTLGAGEPVFLSETGGVDGIATNVEPITVGAVSYQIGYIKDPTGYTGVEGELANVQLRFGGRVVIA